MLSGLELWLSTTKALLAVFKGDSSEDALLPGEAALEGLIFFPFLEGVTALCFFLCPCLVRGGDLSSPSEAVVEEAFRFEPVGGFELWQVEDKKDEYYSQIVQKIEKMSMYRGLLIGDDRISLIWFVAFRCLRLLWGRSFLNLPPSCNSCS